MKLVWCPETASKAFIDAVKALTDNDRNLDNTNVAELLAAMAGGWKAQLIVEAWNPDEGIATSLSLQAAKTHANGRYICMVPDKQSEDIYTEAMKRAGASVEAEALLVGEAKDVMAELEGVDLLVVDWSRKDARNVLRFARPGARGMVVVCKGTGRRRVSATALMGSGTVSGVRRRVVRSTVLPIGSGVEVVHVGVGKGPSLGSGSARWVRHFDEGTKEEHVFRR